MNSNTVSAIVIAVEFALHAACGKRLTRKRYNGTTVHWKISRRSAGGNIARFPVQILGRSRQRRDYDGEQNSCGNRIARFVAHHRWCRKHGKTVPGKMELSERAEVRSIGRTELNALETPWCRSRHIRSSGRCGKRFLTEWRRTRYE